MMPSLIRTFISGAIAGAVAALVLAALAHGMSEVAQLLGDAMTIRNGG